MNVTNPTAQPSALAPLYPQTQQELKSESRAEAESENPVEASKETSNEQQPARTDSNPEGSGQVDTYA
jgi:hypothetical protein